MGESMVAGLNLEETNPESENEVTSATSHHTSLDAFLDLGVPVKRPELKSAKSLPSTLKTSASLKPEIQNKTSDSGCDGSYKREDAKQVAQALQKDTSNGIVVN